MSIQAPTKVTRGQSLFLSAKNFRNAVGDAISPTAVKLYLQYKKNGKTILETILLSHNGDGSFSTIWDSAKSDKCILYCHVRSTDAFNTVAEDFSIELVGGLANPDA